MPEINIAPNKKKILYIITKSNWGGAQRYVHDLATHFREQYDVTVALGEEGELKQKLDLAQIKTISIPFLERDIHIKNEIKVFFWILKLLKSLEPNIVHLNSSKVGALGTVALKTHNSFVYIKNKFQKPEQKKTPCHIFFTAHGWAFNEDRGPIFKNLTRMAHWITILLSHKTICVSHKTAHQVKDFPFLKNKISVIYNGISKITFLRKGEAQNTLIETNQKMKDFFGSLDPKTKKGILWIGTISELHKNKGLEYCLTALSKLRAEYPSFVFLVIGHGEEKENLERSIQEKGLENHVYLLGKVENAAKLLKALNIFTLTSITEALPYTLLEAGLAELPVIASNVGGIPEIIDQVKSGVLVRPREEREIREAIEFLLEHKDKRKFFAANLKTKIKEQFSMEKMVEETRKVYEEAY